MYKCKKCPEVVMGEHTFGEIVAMKKLCPACHSESSAKSIRRVSLKESKRLAKARR